MFESDLVVYLPLTKNGNHALGVSVATFTFDPGLQKGEEINLQNVSFTKTRNQTSGKRTGTDKTFTFRALVLGRKKGVVTENRDGEIKDIFKLAIELEIADKEIIPEITDYMKEKHPNLKDYKSESE